MPWSFLRKTGLRLPQTVPKDTGVDAENRPGSTPVPTQPIRISLCERCGACCAFFPVTFPQADLEKAEVPAILKQFSLTSGKLLRIMRGTELKPPRCIALQGEIGVRVRCSIYNQRPTTCRKFIRSWECDTGNTLCDRARCVMGLEPFSRY